MKVRLLAEARADLREAAAFYEAQAAGLGVDFIGVVADVLGTLADMPRIGSPYDSTTRQLVLPRFPFKVIYAIGEGTVVVVAVAHHRQRPGYWRTRKP